MRLEGGRYEITFDINRKMVIMHNRGIAARQPYVLQVIVTALIAAVFVIATDAVDYRGVANLFGMFVPPFVLATMMNYSWDRRAFMGMALSGVSLATIIFIGVNFTSYG